MLFPFLGEVLSFFFSLSLAIPQFGLLSHISSLRLSLGHSGLVLKLNNTAHASLFSSHLLVALVWATSLLGVVVRHVICGFYLFIYFPPGYVALWESKTPHRPTSERVSWCLETSPLSQLPPRDGSPSLTLWSLFLYFIFCPTSFRRQWLPFWVPSVLHHRSEVVFWNFFRVQMIFWWICRGGSGLLVPFLWHLRTSLSRIDAFDLWCWRRLLRVSWTTRRSNWLILKEISPDYSLEDLMLKLKLQYLTTWCEELTHWKRPWCWERLRMGEGDGRGWKSCMASLIWWTWVWVSSGSWWWTGKPGVLQSMESQRVGHDWATELNWKRN